ncbi:MAG: cupin domain-containing protein [Alphaproteobacteria bacterium]
MSNSGNSQFVRRGLLMAGVLAGALAAATAASAGECPADKMVMSGKGQKAGAMAPKDVTDTVLGSINLAKEPIAINDRQFRLRRLEIMPGGEVPWHSHDDRPALIYIVEGEVTEYSSDCSVPIIHKAGEVSPETREVAHWWKNTGKTKAVLISADLLHAKADGHVM